MRSLFLSLCFAPALATAHANLRSLGGAGITTDETASQSAYHVVRLTYKPAPITVPIKKKGGSSTSGTSGTSGSTTATGIEVLAQYSQAPAYFAELNFKGQPIEVHVDTGSSHLLIPTTKQHDAELLDTIPGKRLNLTKAGARLVACEEAACKGPCNAELLSHYGKRLSCGPNGGVCASAKWFSDAAELNINSGGSATAPPNVCLFYDGYGDGGFAVGFLAESEVDLAGFKLKAKYGAIDAAGQYIYSAAQGGGVMGLAFPGEMDCTDFSCFPSLFNTLVANRKSRVRDVFAICGGYKEEVTINEGAAPPPVAPLLLLGGGDLRLCASKIKWVPMVEPFDKYRVDAMDVKVGTGANMTSLGQGNKLPAMIIATGTNDVYVPTNVYEGFKAHLQTNYCHIHSVCGPTGYTIFDGRGLEDPESDFTGLPSLHIMLNETSNFALELSPRQYMRRFYHEDTGKVYHHLRIHPEKSDRFVIGEVLLSKYYLEFDRVKRRMGFAISVTDCAGAIGH